MAIERKCGVGLLCLQNDVDGFARALQKRILYRTLGKNRSVASGDQQDVAIAFWHLELLSEMQNHFAAGDGASGFEEAEVARGDFGFTGEIKLTEAPAPAPVAEEIADRLHGAHANLTLA